MTRRGLCLLSNELHRELFSFVIYLHFTFIQIKGARFHKLKCQKNHHRRFRSPFAISRFLRRFEAKQIVLLFLSSLPLPIDRQKLILERMFEQKSRRLFPPLRFQYLAAIFERFEREKRNKIQIPFPVFLRFPQQSCVLYRAIKHPRAEENRKENRNYTSKLIFFPVLTFSTRPR